MAIERPKNLIEYIINNTSFSQADVARKLKVSRAQVSKWKAGESISSDRTSELLALAGLFDTVCIDWAMFAKTESNAQAWYDYVLGIVEDVEWGDSLKDFFNDVPDLYVGHLIRKLSDLGANIDQLAPTAGLTDEDDWEPSPLSSVLFSILEAWGQLRDWMDHALEFEDMTDDAEYDLLDPITDLEWLASDLALDEVDRDELKAIGVEESKLEALIETSRNEVTSRLHNICRIRTKHGLPITDNYFQMLYVPAEELAEQSWFRPGGGIEGVDEDLIKSYLPYGQRLILSHLECSARALRQLNKKLDRVVERLGT